VNAGHQPAGSSVARVPVPECWYDSADREFMVPVRVRGAENYRLPLSDELYGAFLDSHRLTAHGRSRVSVRRTGGALHFTVTGGEGDDPITVSLRFGALPAGRYRFGDGFVLLAPPRLLEAQLPVAHSGHVYIGELPHRHFRSPPSWDLSSGEVLPGGLTLGQGIISGVVTAKAGHYVFSVTATDDDRRAASRSYFIEVRSGTRPPRLRRAVAVDADHDRRFGRSDFVSLIFDSIVAVGEQPMGGGLLIQQRTDRFSIELTGPRLHEAFRPGGAGSVPPGVLMDGNGVALGELSFRVRQTAPVRRLNWVVDEPLIPTPVTQFDDGQEAIVVEGLPAGVEFTAGRLRGVPQTENADPKRIRVTVGGRLLDELSYVTYPVPERDRPKIRVSTGPAVAGTGRARGQRGRRPVDRSLKAFLISRLGRFGSGRSTERGRGVGRERPSEKGRKTSRGRRRRAGNAPLRTAPPRRPAAT